jgi:hypothetical protein
VDEARKNVCRKCGCSTETRVAKYCGLGNDKDNEHHWEYVFGQEAEEWDQKQGARALATWKSLHPELFPPWESEPLTTESLIQEFGFKPVEGGTEHDIFLDVAGGAWLRTWPEFTDREGERRFYLEKGNNVWALGLLRPRTKGQLRRLLSLLADIQASLEGEEGKG